MKRFLLAFAFLISIASCAEAQWPYVPIVQSMSNRLNAASITCVFNSNVTSGDYIIVAFSWFSTNNTPAVSDTRSSSYTQDLFDTGHTERVAVYSATLGSSGANTVTVAITSATLMNVSCLEVPPVWTRTVDVSSVTTFSGTPSTVTSPTITTTLNNDLVIAFFGNDNSAGGQELQAADLGTWYKAGSSSGGDSQGLAFRVGGAAGAGNTVTMDNLATLGTRVSIAYKSSSIAITNGPTAPDGATSNAYNWCVLAAGGNGSDTWSVSSGALPASLSINSSTGCITGTPTVSNNYTATIQVTDGTHTTSQAITFKIATGLNTIAFVQGKSAASNVGSASIAFTSNVTSGNVVIAEMGYSATNSQVDFCTDSLGTVLKTYVIYSYKQTSASTTAFIQIMMGIATSTGADTVTCGGSLLLSVGEFSNINYLGMDNAVATRGANASPATITTSSLTTLVPNELLYGSCGSFTTAGSSAINSPFTRVGNTTWAQTEGYNLATTVTGYTMSCAQTGNTNTNWLMALIGLRPSGGTVVPPVGNTIRVYQSRAFSERETWQPLI